MLDNTTISRPPRQPFTWAGVLHGARLSWPLVMSGGAGGLMMGVTYRELGIDLAHAMLLSATIFSGTAQAVTAALMVAMPMPLAAMALALVGINARYLVMSAHLRRMFPDTRLSTMLPTLFLLVDGAWMIAVSQAEKGRRDAGMLLGAGVPIYLGWLLGTFAGHAAGFAPTGPLAAAAAFLPLGFIIALIPSQWKGRATLLPWCVTVAVALAALLALPSAWAALVGAAAGTLTSALGDKHDA